MNTQKFLRVLGWAGAAVQIGGVSIAHIGAQDPGDPFHDHGDKGKRSTCCRRPRSRIA
jgi:hypothetical protein